MGWKKKMWTETFLLKAFALLEGCFLTIVISVNLLVALIWNSIVCIVRILEKFDERYEYFNLILVNRANRFIRKQLECQKSDQIVRYIITKFLSLFSFLQRLKLSKNNIGQIKEHNIYFSIAFLVLVNILTYFSWYYTARIILARRR